MRLSAPQAIGEHARTYYLELFYILLFMIYGVNYLFGRRTNEQIATAWYTLLPLAPSPLTQCTIRITQYRQLLEQNFSKVGDEALLAKESQSCYILSATGRRNCLGLQATLEVRNLMKGIHAGSISPLSSCRKGMISCRFSSACLVQWKTRW